MFGSNNSAPAPSANRPSAADVAQIESNLTQVMVSGDSVADIHIFANGIEIPAGDIESLSIEIIAPDDSNSAGAATAVLSRYQTGVTGNREQRATSLFPGTVEIIARRRRIVITCREAGSFDGLWLGLGLRADGTSSELSGVQSLRLAVAPGIVDAKLTWSEGGATEDLLPVS